MTDHWTIEQQATQRVAEAYQWDVAGRPDTAALLYQAALDLRPDHTQTRLRLADCLVRCNRPTDAAHAYLRVAQAYSAARREAEALALCHRAVALDVQPFVYLAVGPMLRRMGRIARPVCAQAAEAHLAAGRVADGFHMLRLGAEIDGRNPAVHRRLAALYLSHHMISDGVVHLTEAGRLLLAAGNNAEYINVAQLLLQYAPRHLATLRQLPRVLLRMGEPQRAVARLSELMRENPGDPEGYEILAHAYAVLGRTTTALSILERLVDELRRDRNTDTVTAILGRARGWRIDDADFRDAVAKLRVPQPPPAPAPSRPTTNEGTVILDLGDLLSAQADGDLEVLDASDLIEIEASIVRAAPPPPPAPAPASEETMCLDLNELELELEENTVIRRVPVTSPGTSTPPPIPGADVRTTGEYGSPRRPPLPPPPRPGRRLRRARR